MRACRGDARRRRGDVSRAASSAGPAHWPISRSASQHWTLQARSSSASGMPLPQWQSPAASAQGPAPRRPHDADARGQTPTSVNTRRRRLCSHQLRMQTVRHVAASLETPIDIGFRDRVALAQPSRQRNCASPPAPCGGHASPRGACAQVMLTEVAGPSGLRRGRRDGRPHRGGRATWRWRRRG